jgi:hypothetical protein
MLSSRRRLPLSGVVDQGPDPPDRSIPGRRETQESRSMIQQTGLPSTESDVEEPSMRWVEYALAFVAVLAAGVLAFLR